MRRAPPRQTRRRDVIAVVVIAVGIVLVGYGLAVPIKQAVAHVLVQRAWGAAPPDGPAPRPWPWANTRPVARIEAPKQGVRVIVLADASHDRSSFGPSHVDGTALPGTRGHSVVAAHDGDDFAFLQFVALGQELLVERPGGTRVTHLIVDIRIIDARTESVVVDDTMDALTLVTCYPFGDEWDPVQPLRYVVTAVAESPEN